MRHGLYRRRVADRGGAVYESFPIPRFRCRRRGPRTPRAATFSVLPVELVPRRRASLPLMVWILDHLLEAGRSMRSVLDALADAGRSSPRPWYPEAPAVYRMVRLFAEACPRLGSEPETAGEASPGPESRRRQARWVLGVLTRPARASPVVLAYHRRCFPRILFGSRGADTSGPSTLPDTARAADL